MNTITHSLELDTVTALTAVAPAARAAAAHPARAAACALPAGVEAALLMRVLDEIDYGLMLVSASGVLHHANQLGLQAATGHGPLVVEHGRLRARALADQAPLHAALADAQRGRRRLFSIGQTDSVLSVAAVPMDSACASGTDSGETLVLLVFGKRSAAETLTVDFYARSHGLTGAESNVLRRICGGSKPKEIARDHGVAISTVRSHICSIRIKTRTDSIRELINRVAVLPPITSAMKASAWQAPAQSSAAVH